jgi:hypothetical protein
MSDHDAKPGAHDQDHAASGLDASGHGHGHDDHGHGGMELGPIDWRMWGTGVVGVIAALILTAGFVIATAFSFTA